MSNGSSLSSSNKKNQQKYENEENERCLNFQSNGSDLQIWLNPNM